MKGKHWIDVPDDTTVIYARFSSHNQNEQSLDAQIRACKEYAERNGLNIVDIYADSAQTGTNAEREQFQRMINDGKNKKFKVVLIHKIVRFSRSREDSFYYKRQLRLNGVKIISISENIDDSIQGELMEGIFESFAQFYSRNLAQEVQKGLKEAAYNAVHLGGIPPLGYDVCPTTRKYLINPEEAKIIRIIFERYASGIGYNQIVDYLNGMGFKTKSYTTKDGKFIPGRPFGKGSLNNILKNEKYAGIYVFNKKLEKDVTGKRRPQLRPKEEWIIVENGLPAIIDKDVFNAVQNKISVNANNGGKFKAKEIYLLSGLVECGECGSSMSGNSHKCGRNKSLYVSYRCVNRSNRKGCENKELRREYLENYVLDELNSKLFSESSIRKLSDMLTDYNNRKIEANKDELEYATIELTKVMENISTVVKLVSQSGVTIETVSEDLKKLDERKRYLETYISELTMKNAGVKISEEMIVDLINRSKEFVRSKNIPEIRQFINAYVEKVIVFNNKVEVIFKINVPDDNDTLAPLTSEGDIKQIQRDYIKVI